MKNLIEYKDNPATTLDVDSKARRLKNAFNQVGNKDSDKDIIEANAYDKTIAERGPNSKNLIAHLTDHTPRTANLIGKFSELYVDRTSRYLVGVTNVPKTTLGNDILELYSTGNINQHSIGFSITKSERFNENDYANSYRVIKEVKLYEGSTVLWGANENTPNISVGKSIEERTTALKMCTDEMESLSILFRKGNVSDEMFELLEYRMLQLGTMVKQIFESFITKQEVLTNTEAAEKTLQPNDEQVALTNKLLLLKAKFN